MKYRICKQFEVENGHLLTKHRERCRFPHGHTRKVEVVLEAEELDENDMVVDFKALKLAVGELIDQFDHALCVNTADALYPALQAQYGGPGGRLIPYQGEDPTSEVMARQLFELITARLQGGGTVCGESGNDYQLPATLRLRRLRLWETSSSWAEVEDC
ncbi:MAG: 6-carboxytetrahydropterin synthase [Fimbriimonadaceae bacterium]|nr:6-carboxytetrahydropterin synthase [Fimbriimonadaceae bacterium]